MWKHDDGTPLKFQDGDYVKIDISEHPERAYSLPFRSGYVRGYDISGPDQSVGYQLVKMGHNPLEFVKEHFLTKIPEDIPHTCVPGSCGICQ